MRKQIGFSYPSSKELISIDAITIINVLIILAIILSSPSESVLFSWKHKVKWERGISADVMHGVNHVRCNCFHLIALLCAGRVTVGRPFGRNMVVFHTINWSIEWDIKNWNLKKLFFCSYLSLKYHSNSNKVVFPQKCSFCWSNQDSGQHIWACEWQDQSDVSELWPC